MTFILWDSKDGEPPRTDDGGFNTGGILGELTPGNVYLTTYPKIEGGKKLADLEIGQYVTAEYRLSGDRGTYRIYRVS